MPIYTYECTQCGRNFECLVGMTQEKKTLQCPSCSSKNVKKALSRFQIGRGAGSSSVSSSRCSSCSGGDCTSCSS